MDQDLPAHINHANHLPGLDSEQIMLPLEYDRTARDIYGFLSEQLGVAKRALLYLDEERSSREASKPVASFLQQEQDVSRVRSYNSIASQPLGVGALDGSLLTHCLCVLKTAEVFKLSSEFISVLKKAYFDLGKDPLERLHLQPLVANRLGGLMVALGNTVTEAVEVGDLQSRTPPIDYYEWQKTLPKALVVGIFEQLEELSNGAYGLYFDFACAEYPPAVQEARTLLVLRTTGMVRDALASFATLAWQNNSDTCTALIPSLRSLIGKTFNSNFSEIIDYCESPDADSTFRCGFIHNFARTLEHLRGATDSPVFKDNTELRTAITQLKADLEATVALAANTLSPLQFESSPIAIKVSILLEEITLFRGEI